MKKPSYALILFFILLTVITNISILAQNNSKWTWEETSFQDFSSSTLKNLIVTNSSGGEVQFPHPMQKIVTDFRDDSIHRFISRDSSASYIRTWVANGNIYAQKYLNDTTTLSDIIQVNDTLEGNSRSRVALMNDGTYIVVWNKTGNYDYSNMLGQVLNAENEKIGSNFKINHIQNYSNYSPVVFANETDGLFWIFFSLKVGDGYKINVEKRDKNGNKVGDTFLLNTGSITTNEISPSVAADNNDNFIVTWEGTNENSSNYTDIFMRKFDSNGDPLSNTQKVNDDNKIVGQREVDICSDNNNGFLIVWVDERDMDYNIQPYIFNIYGQYYNSTNHKVGENFRINDPIYNSNNSPDVDFNNDKFSISYKGWNDRNRRNEIYINKWKLSPKFWGESISSIFDTGPGGSEFRNIYWDETSPPNTSIKFKVRSSSTKEQIADALWYGPTDTSDFFINSLGEEFSTVHNGNRFVQYKAFFNTEVAGVTPALKSITISYIPADTIPPSSPQNLTSASLHSGVELNWNPNQDKDLAMYKIYRGTSSQTYTWTKEVSSASISFLDTSVQNAQTYYYAISAIDSSHNESTLSAEISASPLGITYFVNVNGNASGNGTYSNPFKKISTAMDVAVYGDKIVVQPGIYNETIIIKEGVSLSASNSQPVIIQGNGMSMIEMKDATLLDGFTLIQSGIGDAINCKGKTIKIRNNNIIHEYSSEPVATAIECKNSEVEIVGNYISSFYIGIEGLGKTGSDQKSVLSIHNNIIECVEGIYFFYDCNADIYNNTIVFHDKQSGVGVESRWGNNISFNSNIIVGSSTSSGIGIYNDGGTPTTVSTSFNNIWNVKEKFRGEVNEGFGNISFDPLFVNKEKNDYHLQEGSRCIDAGNFNSNYNDVDGSRNDIGAYGGPTPFISLDNLQKIKKIRLSNVSGFPSDTVVTFISLEEPEGLGMADFSIKFDASLLTPIETKVTYATKNFILQTKIIDNSNLQIHLEGEVTEGNKENKILKLSFLVNPNANPGDASQLSIKNPILFDENYNDIFLTTITDGVFIVNQGNINGNYIFVDAKNVDTGDGSIKNPANTIQAGINMAVAGDTIVVAAGEYNEKIVMKEDTYLRGAGAKVTTILGTEEGASVSFQSINNSEISGFTFKTSDDPEIRTMISCNSSSPLIKKNRFLGRIPMPIDRYGVMCSNHSNPIIEENSFDMIGLMINESSPIIRNNFISGTDGGLFGIDCNSNSSPLITKNKILGGNAGDAVVRISESNPTIMNNSIDCNGGIGFEIIKGSNVIIKNNIIKDLNMGTGIYIRESSDIQIFNNSIITKENGIIVTNSTTTIVNNIIVDNNRFGVQASSSSTINYNDIWNNNLNYKNCSAGTNDISVDPLFVDESGSNFNLLPTSLCIDSGHPDEQYNDKDGSRNDMGAFGGPDADLSWINNENASLTIDSNEVINSDSIQVKILGSSIKDIAKIDITISYNSDVLQFIDVKPSILTNSFSVSKTIVDSSTIKLSFDSQFGIANNSGTLAELIFKNKSKHSLKTYLNFDQAKVSDDLTSNRNISKLNNGVVSITVTDIKNKILPTSYSISQNYPNPFNPTTVIEYSLPEKNKVEIKLYDLLGREVRTLLNEERLPGKYNIKFNASGLASGVYFYRITAGRFIKTKKMILLR